MIKLFNLFRIIAGFLFLLNLGVSADVSPMEDLIPGFMMHPQSKKVVMFCEDTATLEDKIKMTEMVTKRTSPAITFIISNKEHLKATRDSLLSQGYKIIKRITPSKDYSSLKMVAAGAYLGGLVAWSFDPQKSWSFWLSILAAGTWLSLDLLELYGIQQSIEYL